MEASTVINCQTLPAPPGCQRRMDLSGGLIDRRGRTRRSRPFSEALLRRFTASSQSVHPAVSTATPKPVRNSSTTTASLHRRMGQSSEMAIPDLAPLNDLQDQTPPNLSGSTDKISVETSGVYRCSPLSDNPVPLSLRLKDQLLMMLRLRSRPRSVRPLTLHHSLHPGRHQSHSTGTRLATSPSAVWTMRQIPEMDSVETRATGPHLVGMVVVNLDQF